MHFGPRLMRSVAPFGEAAEEVSSLREVLAKCPGVKAVKSIEPHSKGGYVAVMDFSMDDLNQYIEHLEKAGWMNVL